MNVITPYLAGLIFSVIHLCSPRFFRYRHRLDPYLQSITGGFASAYIFLELLPSISQEQSIIGQKIYLIILLGFLCFFGLEYSLHHSRQADHWVRIHLSSGLFQASLYNILLALALVQELPRSPLPAVIFSVLIGFHLLSNNLSLMETYRCQFVAYGRFLLVGAIALGLGIHQWGDPNEFTADIVAAWVAGTVLYQVFRKELPDFAETNFWAFCSGVASFSGLYLLLGFLGYFTE